jgi:hypothetical protein
MILHAVRHRVLAALLAVALFVLPALAHDPASVPPLKPSYDAARYGGGNGRSQESAVVIKAASEAVGVGSEYAWIADAYPGAKVIDQALTAWENGKRYDILTVKTSGGERLTLWFDISAMYK